MKFKRKKSLVGRNWNLSAQKRDSQVKVSLNTLEPLQGMFRGEGISRDINVKIV